MAVKLKDCASQTSKVKGEEVAAGAVRVKSQQMSLIVRTKSSEPS